MITEDYVSYETSKLLKEKGFDEPCECFYDTEHNDISIINGWMNISNSQLEEREWRCYSAPTLQMAIKWLREKYSLEIYSYHNNPTIYNSKWWFEIIEYPNSVAEYESGKDEEFDTYEEACEAAIRYCLENLI